MHCNLAHQLKFDVATRLKTFCVFLHKLFFVWFPLHFLRANTKNHFLSKDRSMRSLLKFRKANQMCVWTSFTPLYLKMALFCTLSLFWDFLLFFSLSCFILLHCKNLCILLFSFFFIDGFFSCWLKFNFSRWRLISFDPASIPRLSWRWHIRFLNAFLSHRFRV